MPAFSLGGRLSKHTNKRRTHRATARRVKAAANDLRPGRRHHWRRCRPVRQTDSITVSRTQRVKERKAFLLAQRTQWREERKQQLLQKQKQEEDNSEDEAVKPEPITLQITETRTRSEKVDNNKPEPEKDSKVEKKEKAFVDKYNVPPGPGQYTLPTSVH